MSAGFLHVRYDGNPNAQSDGCEFAPTKQTLTQTSCGDIECNT